MFAFNNESSELFQGKQKNDKGRVVTSEILSYQCFFNYNEHSILIPSKKKQRKLYDLKILRMNQQQRMQILLHEVSNV